MDNLPKQNENSPKRITWGLIWGDFLNVINFEKGVLFTIKGLLLKPKETVDDYLYGNRVLHASPLRFLILSTAIISLLNFYLILKPSLDSGAFTQTDKGSVYEFGKGVGKNINLEFTNEDADSLKTKEDSLANKEPVKKLNKEEQKQIIQESMDNLFKWMDKFTFAMVPIFSIFTFLFFRKSGYNYTENLVSNAFMISFTNVLGIAFIIPSYYSPMMGGTILSMISFGYMLRFIYKVFAFPGFKGALLSMVTFVLSYLIFVIVIGAFLIYFVFDSVSHL